MSQIFLNLNHQLLLIGHHVLFISLAFLSGFPLGKYILNRCKINIFISFKWLFSEITSDERLCHFIDGILPAQYFQ